MSKTSLIYGFGMYVIKSIAKHLGPQRISACSQLSSYSSKPFNIVINFLNDPD